MDIDREQFHDYYNLEEIQESFDVVFLFEVIEHLNLEECGQLIKRGSTTYFMKAGRKILTTPNIFNPSRFWRDVTHQGALSCYDELGGFLLAQGFQIRGDVPDLQSSFPPVFLQALCDGSAPPISGHRLCQIDSGDCREEDERNKMRIIFLTHTSDQGHRFRVEQYFPYLPGNTVWNRSGSRSRVHGGSCFTIYRHAALLMTSSRIQSQEIDSAGRILLDTKTILEDSFRPR